MGWLSPFFRTSLVFPVRSRYPYSRPPGRRDPALSLLAAPRAPAPAAKDESKEPVDDYQFARRNPALGPQRQSRRHQVSSHRTVHGRGTGIPSSGSIRSMKRPARPLPKRSNPAPPCRGPHCSSIPRAIRSADDIVREQARKHVLIDPHNKRSVVSRRRYRITNCLQNRGSSEHSSRGEERAVAIPKQLHGCG